MKDRNSKDQLTSDIQFLQELEKAIKQNHSHEALMLVKDWKSELQEMSTSPVTTPWCQIYQVEGQQILVRIKMNTEEDEMEISQCLYVGDMFVEASIGGFERNDTTAEVQFKKYTQANAEKFYNSMIKFLE